MTEIRPFRALRYDPARVSLAKVIVPPYDVIAAGDREGFYARDPHNAIRLELTRGVEDEARTDYADVRGTLARWTREGVLVRDARPALYALRQSLPRARRQDPRARRLLRPAPPRGLRAPHRAPARAHARGPEGRPAQDAARDAGESLERVPALRGSRGGAARGVWPRRSRPSRSPARATRRARRTGWRGSRIAALIESVRSFLEPRPLVIADGHHRYETALAYPRRAPRRGARRRRERALRVDPRLLRERLRARQPAAPDPPPDPARLRSQRARSGPSGCRAGAARRSR